MGMGKTLINPGEKVGNMLISCPCVPHVLSVQHNDSSTDFAGICGRGFARFRLQNR